MGVRPAKIDQQAIAEILGDIPLIALNYFSGSFLIA